jgi:hypothetical protein
VNKEAEESRNLIAQLAQAARLDWSIGPGYDGEPDLLVPSDRPCPCKGSGQFPDGLPCPVHDTESLAAGRGCGDPKKMGVYPVYGNDGKTDRERGM